MSKPTIKSVAVTKRGRFWAVHTDGELLALVLYKKGAMAVRDLLVCVAGFTVNEPLKGTKAMPKTPSQPSPIASHTGSGAAATRY